MRVHPDGENIKLNQRMQVNILRAGITKALADLTTEVYAIGGADVVNLRSIAYGLRMLLAKTSSPEEIAAAMVPEETATPEAQPEETVTIEVRRRADDFHAQMFRNPGIWGCGKTRQSAIEDLVQSHPDAFHVSIQLITSGGGTDGTPTT